MIELMPDLPDNVVGLVASGQVTANDYASVVIPAIEAVLDKHDSVRVLYQVAPGFTGFSVGAMWDDARMGLVHASAWEKIAVVTDLDWLHGATQFFRFMVPCPVEVFGNDALAAARDWIVA